jgi:hypothetical protein
LSADDGFDAKKILIPASKTSLTLRSPLFTRDRIATGVISGRVGGAVLWVPEIQRSASPEGSTRGR